MNTKAGVKNLTNYVGSRIIRAIMPVLTQTQIDQLPSTSFAYVAADGAKYLPYKNTEGRIELPMVRDALAQLDDNTAIPAEARADVRSKLQTSMQASDTEDVALQSLHTIQADATTGELPTEIMLLRAGTFHTQKYGEVKVQSSDITEFKSNFDKGLGMADAGQTGLPVDFAHQSHLNAGAWIKDLEVRGSNNDELWGTKLEFSNSGKEAIKGKEYKCLSSDFYPKAFGKWVDPESGITAQNVIVGAAFTNRPMFTGNKPVIASDTQTNEGTDKNKVVYIIASQEKETSMNIDAVRVKAADEVTGPEQRFLQANADKLTDVEKTKFEIVASTTTATTPKVVQASSVTGTEGVVAIEASELKKLSDSISSLEASNLEKLKESVKADVMVHAKRGAIKADRIDSWTNRIVASDEAGRKEILADLAALAPNPVLAETQGSGDADEGSQEGARSQLMADAVEIVKKSEGKTDIQAAYRVAKEAKPELAAQAAAEGRARVSGLAASNDQLAAAGVNAG